MIVLKSEKDIEKMRVGGKITAQVREEVLGMAKPGISTWELEKFAVRRIFDLGGEPGFMRVPGYEYATCTNINEGLVHGIPSKKAIIREGDLFTVDLGTYYKGFHTDAAWTISVRGLEREARKERGKFLNAGEKALAKAIEQCVLGNSVGDISHAIQETIEGAGYNVIISLVGHGVGEMLHEEPQIPCFGESGSGPKLEIGMVVAIEVLYALGNPTIETMGDGWTIKTEDNSLSGLFENTVAITKNGPDVLTPKPRL